MWFFQQVSEKSLSLNLETFLTRVKAFFRTESFYSLITLRLPYHVSAFSIGYYGRILLMITVKNNALIMQNVA